VAVFFPPGFIEWGFAHPQGPTPDPPVHGSTGKVHRGEDLPRVLLPDLPPSAPLRCSSHVWPSPTPTLQPCPPHAQPTGAPPIQRYALPACPRTPFRPHFSQDSHGRQPLPGVPAPPYQPRYPLPHRVPLPPVPWDFIGDPPARRRCCRQQWRVFPTLDIVVSSLSFIFESETATLRNYISAPLISHR